MSVSGSGGSPGWRVWAEGCGDDGGPAFIPLLLLLLGGLWGPPKGGGCWQEPPGTTPGLGEPPGGLILLILD